MVNDPVDILFAMSEIDDPQILKLQRLGDLAKCGLRSHDLGLSAVESANWNPLKKVWAEKHSKKEHGTTRDETDDILDIIYGTNVRLCLQTVNCYFLTNRRRRCILIHTPTNSQPLLS